MFTEDLTGTGSFTTGSEEITTATSQVEEEEVVEDEELGEEEEIAEEEEEEELTTNCIDDASRILQRSLDYTEGGVQLITAYFRMKSKIDKLTKKLMDCNGLAESKEICDAIKICADTALSIKKLL